MDGELLHSMGMYISGDLINEYGIIDKDHAIIKYLQNNLIEDTSMMNSYIKNNISKLYFQRIIDDIKIIQNIETSSKDFTPSKDFVFYPLCQYAKMYNFPESIKYDWYQGIKQMVNIMESYPEHTTYEDKEWLKKIKIRLESHRFNKN